MKISQKFTNIKNESLVLIVCGRQVGKIYTVENQELDDAPSLYIPTPEYTDREGHFEQRSKGGQGSKGRPADFYAGGAPYENKKDYVETQFINSLKDKMQDFVKNKEFDAAYLFAPDFMMDSIKSVMPDKIKKCLKTEFRGNYIKIHPLKLLEKINALYDEDPTKPKDEDKEEVKKILVR